MQVLVNHPSGHLLSAQVEDSGAGEAPLVLVR
jgi:hypothetical protein